MDNNASSSISERCMQNPPEGITRVNDSVWIFNDPGQVPEVDIIFFHGLQRDYKNAFWKTWLARVDQTVVWPKDWLSEEFPKARITSVSYDCSTKEIPGQLDLYRLGENLQSDIIINSLNLGQSCPVILVGHCVGGIVLKQFLIAAIKESQTDARQSQTDARHNKIKAFVQNVKGVFYYGTPHGGSEIVSFSRFILGSTSPYVELLKIHESNRQRINAEFSNIRRSNNIKAYSVAESLPTIISPEGFNGLVVYETSSRVDVDCLGYYTAEKVDHFDVCRPDGKTSGIFLKLSDFVNDVLEDFVFDNKQVLPIRAVGLEILVKTIQEKLEKNAKVEIWGTGGKGKTVLAKAMFNKLSPKFDYSCFIPEVKLLQAARKEVKYYMHYRGKQVANGWSISELRGRQLLLVLDDVDDNKDLEFISILDELATKVWCIVTTRNRCLLENSDFDFDTYEMPFLSKKDSRQLFTSHALPDGAVEGVSDKQVEDIVSQCHGLSLSLVVIGKYLRNRKKLIWEQALEALVNADDVAPLEEKLWMPLRVSYDGLGQKEQQMFLDATTFFQTDWQDSWTLRDAKAAWSASYGNEDIRWQTLVDLSLVYEVDEGKQIRVHEQLQSLGRKIALDDAEAGKPMRVWDGDVSCYLLESTLANDQEIHSLIRNPPKRGVEREDQYISRSLFGRLKNVQHMCFSPTAMKAMAAMSIIKPSQNVNWTFPRNKLAVLACYFERCLVGAPFPRLAVLRLKVDDDGYNENDLSSFFARMPCLKILTLWRFSTSTGESLESVPDEIGHLPQLKRLVFVNGKFRKLPDTLVGGPLRLTLEHLIFRCCNDLATFPDSFGELSALTYLSFVYCSSFLILPESFGNLQALEHLSFDRSGLQRLPESFGSISSLQFLSICDCKGLQTLPESFGSLSSLRHLIFSCCDGLHTLPSPQSFGLLKSLEILEIYNCRRVESLPFSAEHLPVALRRLSIGFIAITRIPDCIKGYPSLQILEFRCLPDLEKLPPWLGEDSGQKPKTFRVQSGHFQLQREETLNNYRQQELIKWVHEKAMDKVINKGVGSTGYGEVLAEIRNPVYAGALAKLRSLNLEIVDSSGWTGFILLEMGILRRLMGDLNGALKDVTDALELVTLEEADKEFEPDGWEAKRQKWIRYLCLKHRGFIKHLLGNNTGARDDAEKAIQWQNSDMFLPCKWDYDSCKGDYKSGLYGLPNCSLGESRIPTYLDFKFYSRRMLPFPP